MGVQRKSECLKMSHTMVGQQRKFLNSPSPKNSLCIDFETVFKKKDFFVMLDKKTNKKKYELGSSTMVFLCNF